MRKLVIGNWKMHYGSVKAGAWVRAFRRERLPKELEIAIAVPHVSLPAARSSLGRAGVPLLAAQDVFWMNDGAYTGEVSPMMLKEFGTVFCLVGHSERRLHLGETDEMVAKKTAALTRESIRPIICVGETAAQRKKGETVKVVRAQITSVLGSMKIENVVSPVIAYEPIWAIGSGKPCTSQDARVVHEVIRELLFKKFGRLGQEVPIIYGGSVDAHNVTDYMNTTAIDGVLVGSGSLDPREFGILCRAAAIAV